MLDIVYVAASIGFFALMLAYVVGCERLGRSRAEGGEEAGKP